ncbi:MAG: hypothetical protein A3F82_06025 [Deltaproteobacteria bacterium RIFCSPLOWO2_12_FULL_44_12]|nr:MAG: hypothetical protein A2712_01280 [Deltaproteobacteria bacterium RIFCSPHIGHO2_01_FULL_43_49]OGQ15233.1 MAG: hypothetical protein A3D22_04195 [Deltaproteobacteria bacterium RIFCSPHIGHO2_02_FULL_44_53]OGQ27144.1 MAG: hypothetical protein A3D98_01870 [Deltaproteobacteria bacterium RIFCSPHIGHO2_12_FULL_44_21]OGQ31749.1 MAG: hypothetical protein A2979_05355 [Deltaproteobacteria bacterium RIFCSPLOWO2_01_FULL_45_74]OGQ42950.1 MAG: hypothetical protein A3I70_07660 [Deltaproteobacteria bacterium 
MKEKSPITAKEMWRITLNLTLVCFSAALILGVVFNLTEPKKRSQIAANEKTLIQKLLNLDEKAKILEVRRYLGPGQPPTIGYLLSDELRQYNLDGKFLKKWDLPEVFQKAPTQERDEWVEKEFPESHFVGRFFAAQNPDGTLTGYVTEGSQYGFKSLIRFFVALSQNFQIRGVEVISHEEDPGLGDEITKPAFKNQFLGIRLEDLQTLKLTKGPKPEEVAPEKEKQIYAVTGATISSQALVDGVKQAVWHLERRLNVVR